jgi:hypothetical protein
MLWRRGWDSNPRNGFPLTAFPVLPIQPLLHLSSISDCQSPIANWPHAYDKLLWTMTNWKLAIKKSAMSWRRGWDSNPRWALTHSGFRDRCTNPLCDLSVWFRSGLPPASSGNNPTLNGSFHLLALKNSCINSRHSASQIPLMTST